MNPIYSSSLFELFYPIKEENKGLSAFGNPSDFPQMVGILSRCLPTQHASWQESGALHTRVNSSQFVPSQPDEEEIARPFKKRLLERMRTSINDVKGAESFCSATTTQKMCFPSFSQVIISPSPSHSSSLSPSLSLTSMNVNQEAVAEHLSELKNIDIAFTEKNRLYLDKIKNRVVQTSEFREEIMDWELSILENGISDRMDILVQGRQSCIYLKEPIKKGAFVGVLAGSISCIELSGKKSFLFAQNSKANFYLNRTDQGNFLQDLPVSRDGNVRLNLVYDTHSNQFQFILIARKNIPARTNLTLQEFAPIRF